MKLFPEKGKQRSNELILECVNVLQDLFSVRIRWEGILPRCIDMSPSYFMRLHVNHPTPRDSSWRCFSQIHWLKYQIHVFSHTDCLSATETKLASIIEYGVHVFNPKSIHRPIEYQPFSLVCFYFRISKSSETDSQHSVIPVM